VIELIPTDSPPWRVSNLFAPVSGLFLGGSDYWYAARTIEINTTPPHAVLELAYVRENIQKRFERAEAPILLVLPSRIQAGPLDSINIRALLDGHQQVERKLEVRSRDTELTISLAPLPNVLSALSHTYFSGRGRLKFLTSEAAKFRVQKLSDGFSIALLETALSRESAKMMEGVSSPNIELVRGEPLGEDLVIRVKLRAAARDEIEMRSAQGYDPVRDLHHLAIDLVPTSERAGAEQRARNALAKIDRADVFGCALDFDRSMRLQLDPADLARSLAPTSTFLDPYLRAALKRLGEISPEGVIEITDGSTFRPSVPIELSAGMTRSAEVVGYLALLRQFVANLEAPSDRWNILHGILAPEESRSNFDSMVEVAESLERHCHGGH
jgi:hypothetical protein